jgi:hypothetical protein
MKPSIILEQRLYETKMYSRLTAGMDPKTTGYMQKVRENFTLPFIASINNIDILTEAAMTAQQIQNAFGSAEKIATAGGDNRSMLGKGADAAGAVGAGAVDLAKKGASGVKELANKLLAQNKDKLVQSLPPADAGPVEGFEQKAQEQIAQVQDPKAKKSLMDLVKQAAKNPAVQTLVLAGIAGIATVVAGPAIAGLGLGMAATGALTGTVVGGLTGAVRGLMQGQGLTGALKQGAMGAGLGAAGGGIAGAVAQGAQAYMQNRGAEAQQQATTGELPVDAQAQNQSVDIKAAQEWINADPAERARIEQTTGMPGAQLQDIAVSNDLKSSTDLGAFDSGPGKGWDGQARSPNPIVGKDTFPDGTPIERSGGNSSPGYMKQFGGEQPNQGGETPINPNAGQQQVDLNKMVQNKVDTGAIPAPTDTSAAAATQPDTNRLTGKPFEPAPTWDQMTPDQQAAVTAKQQQQAADDAQGTQNAQNYWANKAAARANGILLRSGHSPVAAINEYVDYELTARMWYIRESVGKPRGNIHLTEAGIGDMFKKAGNWLKTKAGNVTNKVTADKLQQAWKKAGNPTDSGQVAGIMVSAGVPQETVDQVFQNLGLPAGASTVTAAPEAPAKAPGQGLLGKAAGAIGGAIGGVKGAIAGTKDAFAKGQETGFDSARTSQAGDAVGATGEANPYAKQDAQPGQDPQGQQPSYGQGAAPQAYGVAPRSTPRSQGPAAPGSASATAQGTTDTGNDVTTSDRRTSNYQKSLDNMGSAVNTGGTAVADTVNDLNRAVQSGKGMGAGGQSLVRGAYAPGGEGAGRDSVKIKDEYGQDHAYKKVGNKWYDTENKEVPSAIAAMLAKQAEQQAALTKAKTPAQQTAQEPVATTAPAASAKAEPISIGGQKLDPKDPASAKLIAQVQQAPGGTQQAGQTAPATGATPPDLGTQSDGKPIKPGQKFDTETGKPLAQQPDAAPPATTQQAPAKLDPRDLNKDGTVDATEKSIAKNRAKTGATPPAATTTPAGQSPEDIRKAKQADAATAAQGQMAASTQQAQTATNDVMNRMTKQLGTPPAGGPAQPTPDFSKQMTGYGKTTINAPTGVPAVTKPAVPVTTNATTQPAQPEPQGTTLDLDQFRKDQAAKKAQQTAPAVPGFQQTKLNGGGVKQPEPVLTAGIDFSAALLRKMKERV